MGTFLEDLHAGKIETNAETIARLTKQRDDLQSLLDDAQALIQRTNTRDKELVRQRDELVAALENLARLGNGDQYGNSIGNQIAIEALASVKGEKE